MKGSHMTNLSEKPRRGTRRTLGLALAVLCLAFTGIPAAQAVPIAFQGNWGDPGFSLVSQDGAGVEVIYSVPGMELMDVSIEGEAMQEVVIPGVILPNQTGAPNLPSVGRYLALPQGARAELRNLQYRTEVYHNVNLAPAFEIPRDTDPVLRYSKDPTIYGTDAFYPEEPVRLSAPTTLRGVDVVILGITPFQYNPVTKDLIVYKDLRVQVDFIGGNGRFGEDRLRSPWWDPVLEQNLMNYATLPRMDYSSRVRTATDETDVEYLIIIPDDPAFAAWADTLKQWRNAQGIITGITTLSEIGGNNATTIENYINNAYNNWQIPPVAVLLLSDYQNSGLDTYGITSPTYSYGYTCVTDNKYADVDNNHLPEMAIARITAQNNTHLQTMIGKMLNYERNPVTNANFYNNPLMAGGWQTERWFILCTEVIYGYMHNVLGKSPVRQYAIYSGTPGTIWSSNGNTSTVVNYFGPNGTGYITQNLTPGLTWNGNATGINNAINSGSFIIQHRDHGMVTGWGEPSYTINNFSGLNNTAYPFVFSFNCLTGKYNSTQTCFTEAMHRSTYGALGLIAASETSYSFVNDTYCWGVYDFLWPNFDPGYGQAGPVNLKPAFANASGKYYLSVSSWPYNPSNKDETYHLFHHHGDAFLTLYSEVPQNLTVSHAPSAAPGATSFAVTADAGSFIGLSVNGQYVGSAQGTGSAVNIVIPPLVAGLPLRVTVTKPNYYRYIADVATGTFTGMDVTLTPLGTPIQIAASGGSFSYDANLQNNSGGTVNFSAWIMQRQPSGAWQGPMLGPLSLSLPNGANIVRQRSQNVPSTAAAGTYTYVGYVGLYPATKWDSSAFTYTKLTTGDGEAVLDWANWGESFAPYLVQEEAELPAAFALRQNYPNPFNPTTALSYQLAENSHVSLKIYDTAGREVRTLVSGWQDAGVHEVTFDAAGLPSGLYLARLDAGDFSQTVKMMLVK